jgi:hypothetical protein
MLVARLGVVRSEADHHKERPISVAAVAPMRLEKSLQSSMIHGITSSEKKPNTRASQRQKPICATALVHLADLNLGNTPLWLLARA